MITTRSTLHPVLAAWTKTVELLRSNTALFTPLGLAAGVKLTMVGVALVAPFTPFSKFLAPIVRYFWGEIFLHYPYHLALATRWFRRSDLLLPILLEGFLVGMTAYLCRQILAGHPVKVRQAFSETFRRYPGCVLITMVSSLLMIGLAKMALLPIQLGVRWFPILAQSTFAMALGMALVTIAVVAALESLFIFALPSCILEQRAWFRAIGRSVQIAAKSYGSIFLTIFIVTLAYLPFVLLRQGSIRMVTSSWPESILLVYIGRILFTWVIGTMLAVWGTVYLTEHAGASREVVG